ncbi:MAG: tetratricopeptide repeat protein [Deltaproteobacteria bacterium]|nr:tetratricopeptide repeat protein [Deltaproteobacteria bacterium]
MRALLCLLLLLPTTAAAADYIGAAACGTCHAAELQRWQGSHHDRAMQAATPETVLGNFDNATFTKDGVTTTFSRRDGQYVVRTDGPDGALHDYRVAYTFGVAPLQQYLLELPGGRLQALSIAWDTRPRAAGGQRWFHLYPNERIDHRDVLHWSGPNQNWNYMCAECHSTDLRKNYRADGDRFETTWAALNVSCEACHGPGSAHVQWAADAKAGRAAADATRGFAVDLRQTGTWRFADGAPIAHREGPGFSTAQVETCAPCHSRHAQLAAENIPGAPLAQARLVSLLDPGRYHADGQIQDEVYEYGSFIQSRMFHVGVTCSDCHDPHSLALRAPGNALCAQCHAAATFDVAAHTHHATGSPGAQCVACHMVERTYMQIDGRRDHSLRVPRPDLSVTLGTPNACTDCHRDRTAQWAADAVAQWFGPQRRQGWHYGVALAAGRDGRPDAEQQLVRTVQDASLPAIARATAVALLLPYLGPRSLPALQTAARDPDPMVRRAAAETAIGLDAPERIGIAAPLLDDPIRTVRLEALTTLLDLPPERFDNRQRSALLRVADEYRAAQRFNADRAEAQNNLGMLELRTGNPGAARSAFDTAIRLQPTFIPAYINLADLQRLLGDEAGAEATLRKALTVQDTAAEVHHALGLALVRQKRMDEALRELRRAAELAPDTPQYAYVLAIGLHDSGDRTGAIAVLSEAQRRRPASRELLSALAQYSAENGDAAAASRWAQQLRALDD